MKYIKILTRLNLIFLSLALSSCGGGSSSTVDTSTGSTPPPVISGVPSISGTVTGFGSVIVDGKRIDDKNVVAGKEREDGLIKSIELKLGQRIEVLHDGNLVATQIRVMSEVEGTVDKIDLTAGNLSILGQTIFINTDPSLGPITIFSLPYTQLSDIKLNDSIEVHALIKLDSAGKVSMQATRISPMEVGESYQRVHGLIGDFSSTNKTFKLGDLLIDFSNSKLLPSTTTLANGLEVHVSIPLGKITPGVAVKAVVIRAYSRKTESEGKASELSGAISNFDSNAKTFNINGVKIDAGSASFTQANTSFADLKNGSYVAISGNYVSEGILKASTIAIRGTNEEKDKGVEIHGTILNFVSSSNFTVRDVTINASQAKLDPSSCANISQLANNMQVEILGKAGANGVVIASLIKCEKESDLNVTLSRFGNVSNINLTNKTFTLKTEKESITIQWTSASLFIKLELSALEGKRVVVEGSMVAGVFTAKKISLVQ